MRAIAGFSLIGPALAPAVASAADEEIQVYLNDIDAPHQVGLDVHVNYVPSGDATPDYPGQESSLHRLRVTPEWSYALDDHVELGAYLPLATLDNAGHLRADGWKVRVKWLGRHPEHGWFYGVNYEVGRLSYRLDANPWNNEIKLIAGREGKRWLIGGNANFDFALSGPARTPPQVQWASKVGYKVSEATLIGLESYNGLGTTNHFGVFRGNEQSTFVTLDTRIGRWNLNAGLGKGYGASRDSTIVKVVIGVPLQR